MEIFILKHCRYKPENKDEKKNYLYKNKSAHTSMINFGRDCQKADIYRRPANMSTCRHITENKGKALDVFICQERNDPGFWCMCA